MLIHSMYADSHGYVIDIVHIYSIQIMNVYEFNGKNIFMR